jgi:hypoxanthine phosphoribosyltransferase
LAACPRQDFTPGLVNGGAMQKLPSALTNPLALPGAAGHKAHSPMPKAKSFPLHADLETVLVSETEIKKRVKKLGAEIAASYGNEEITVVSIINGAILFTADLLREIPNPIRLDCIRIASYRNDTKSHGKPQLLQSLTLDISNRHVLLIDDILDTGKTFSVVVNMIQKLNPASLRTCVLLDKRGRREVDFEADFVGFQIPDKFAVGYGLDFAERYRNLPCIGVLKPSLQNPPEWA